MGQEETGRPEKREEAGGRISVPGDGNWSEKLWEDR